MSLFKKSSAATRVTEAREKIVEAISTEESKLSRIVQEKVEADTALTAAETGVALGELSESDATAARRKVEGATAAIMESGRRLGGLRGRLVSLSADLSTARETVVAEIPAHVESVKNSFAAEWRKAVDAFSVVLGKRLALEANNYIGKLALPEPRPAAGVELPAEVNAPFRLLEQLHEGLEQVAGFSNMATWSETDRAYPNYRAMDSTPGKVYVLTQPFNDKAAGTLVVAESFPPGCLAHLFNTHGAKAIEDQNYEASLQSGSMAAARIRDEQTRTEMERRRLEEEARFKTLASEHFKPGSVHDVKMS